MRIDGVTRITKLSAARCGGATDPKTVVALSLLLGLAGYVRGKPASLK